MFKVNIYNSITEKNYYNIEFSKEVTFKGKIKKCVNLVYASNGVGKSSTSLILHANYNSDVDVVNYFDNSKKSKVEVLVDDYTITKSFRYDKSFAINSVSLYEGNLIISPQNAVEMSNLENNRVSAVESIINEYKKTQIFGSRLLIENSTIFKKTPLEKFALKSPTKTHAEGYYNILKEVQNMQPDCFSLSLKELIDIGGLIDIKFVTKIKSLLTDVNTKILDEFPEIDRNDFAFYQTVYEYMLGNEALIDKVCLMCGETILSLNLIKKRLDKIKNIIKDFTDKEKSNEFLDLVNIFNLTKFVSSEMKLAQTISQKINRDNLLEKLSALDKIFVKYDINMIKSKWINCILIKILKSKTINDIVSKVKDIETKLNTLYQKNKSTINENVKNRFVSYLENLGFKYFKDTIVKINNKTNSLTLQIKGKTVNNLYQEILSESEKTLLSLSLFFAIANESEHTLIIIDDPVDSHDDKTKWFIINQILEFYKQSSVLLLIFTHDLSFSMTIKRVSKIEQNSFILTSSGLKKVSKPSMHFMEIYDFIFEVEKIISNMSNNAKYYLPLAFLMRYLSKNQNKLYAEFMPSPPPSAISRKMVMKTGFIEISDSFVHYNANVNSRNLLKNIELFMKNPVVDEIVPNYFCDSIPSDELLLKIISDIGLTTQFDTEISTILYSLLIRNILEKRFLNGTSGLEGKPLGTIAEEYKDSHGSDALHKFYLLNKTMVDDFAHIESGTKILLSYDLSTVMEKYKQLLAI